MLIHRLSCFNCSLWATETKVSSFSSYSTHGKSIGFASLPCKSQISCTWERTTEQKSGKSNICLTNHVLLVRLIKVFWHCHHMLTIPCWLFNRHLQFPTSLHNKINLVIGYFRGDDPNFWDSKIYQPKAPTQGKGRKAVCHAGLRFDVSSMTWSLILEARQAPQILCGSAISS